MKTIVLLLIIVVLSSWNYQTDLNSGIYKGLICAWSFDKAGTKLVQSKVNPRDNILGISAIDCYNNSIHTSGSGSYFLQNDNNPLQKLTNKFTASVWVKRTTGTSQGGIYVRDEGAGVTIWNLQITGGGATFLMVIQTSAVAFIQGYDNVTAWSTNNVWYHIVGVYDGTQAVANNRIKLYMNGNERVVTFSGTCPTSLYTPTTSRANIGRPTLEEWISEPKIWDRPLTSSEVRQLYVNEKNLIK
jgi:hypothetical protein